MPVPGRTEEVMPTTSSDSPKVLSHRWGHIEVAGLGAFRDVKLWPGGGRAWDWDETGTRHQAGIQPADLEDLLAHDPEVVVLTRGRELRLETMAATLPVLEQRGVRAV